MNLLAHALLSPDDPAVLAGNLAADWVKGRARDPLPPAMRRGMDLHARIDAFTDSHPLVWRCSELLEPNWGRYSPVLVDILFDHVLSLEWTHYCALERPTVIARAYDALRDRVHLLPPRAQYAVHALLTHDWLTCYATLDGIALSLARLSARLQSRGHHIQLAPAVHDFAAHQLAFHEAFAAFFPQLRLEVERWATTRVD